MEKMVFSCPDSTAVEAEMEVLSCPDYPVVGAEKVVNEVATGFYCIPTILKVREEGALVWYCGL